MPPPTPGRNRNHTPATSQNTYRQRIQPEPQTTPRNPRYFASVTEGHAPFAVVNRTANPVVRAVLSSPLHPLLSRNLALITFIGRRSGRRYTFPVGYRQDGDRVLINVGWPERKNWWRNLSDSAHVEMRIRGARRSGQASAHGDERTRVTVEVQLDPEPAS